jgi:hypothetical protein
VLFLEAMFSKRVKLGFREKMMVETLVVRYCNTDTSMKAMQCLSPSIVGTV